MEAVLKKRLDLRVAEEEKSEIDRAAAMEGMTTSDFIRRTALTAARETIHAHAVAKLTQEGGRKFVAALKNPPPPNEALRELASKYGAEVGK